MALDPATGDLVCPFCGEPVPGSKEAMANGDRVVIHQACRGANPTGGGDSYINLDDLESASLPVEPAPAETDTSQESVGAVAAEDAKPDFDWAAYWANRARNKPAAAAAEDTTGDAALVADPAPPPVEE